MTGTLLVDVLHLKLMKTRCKPNKLEAIELIIRTVIQLIWKTTLPYVYPKDTNVAHEKISEDSAAGAYSS
jgi:hypothetical protein